MRLRMKILEHLWMYLLLGHITPAQLELYNTCLLVGCVPQRDMIKKHLNYRPNEENTMGVLTEVGM
jgi:hypothetical protein